MDCLDLKYDEEFNKYKKMFEDKISKNTYIPRFSITLEVFTQAYKNLLLLNTNIPLVEVINILNEKYSLNIPDNIPYKEMQVYLYVLQLKKCFNKEDSEIISRYNSKEIDLNTKIRVDLYIEGWNPNQIENYIHKYVLKKPFNYNLNLEYYNILINNILLKLSLTRKEGSIKIGRPPLPQSIKKLSLEKHLIKTKENMRRKYAYSESYEKIKDFLLTKEEVESILEVITDENIIKKIKKLQL